MAEQTQPRLRHSMLAPIGPRERVEEIERRLAEAIEMGAFGDGEQLPSEAALASQLRVAATTLRDALAGLRDAGFIETRRGHGGGSFVRNGARERRARLLARLGGAGPDGLRDGGDMHSAVAAAAARRAAERGSPADHRRLALRAEEFGAATTPTGALLADRRFHREIAAVSGSRALARSESRLQAEVGAFAWLLFEPSGIAAATEQHRAILGALVSGEGDRASRLMREHLEIETAGLVDLRLGIGKSGATSRGAKPRMREVLAVAEDMAAQVFAALERVREAVEVPLGKVLSAQGSPAREYFAGLDRQIARELGRQPQLAGMGMALDPGTSGPPWVWWQATADGPAPLLVNLDQGSAELYDYAHAEWYAQPRATNEAWLAGPYVDFGGADDHIFTFGLPISPEGFDEPVGVVGADLTVWRLEERTAAPLSALGRPAALLNRHDIVIATNSGSTLPGTRWSSPAEGEDRVRDDRLGLSVACMR